MQEVRSKSTLFLIVQISYSVILKELLKSNPAHVVVTSFIMEKGQLQKPAFLYWPVRLQQYNKRVVHAIRIHLNHCGVGRVVTGVQITDSPISFTYNVNSRREVR